MRAGRKPQRILVTGATGCIGGRLVERLILERKAVVRVLVRNWSRAIRLARFEVEIGRGDIGNPIDVEQAVEGCSVVVHCAHDWQRPEVNIAAARALIAACIEHRVSRIVFVSSLSVYEPLPEGRLDESAPRVSSGWTYPDTKLRLEHAFEEAHLHQGLPVVTVEPTVVYGPYSEPWTVRPIELIRGTRLVLPDDGEGLCNAVYVDDVVDSLILAIDAESADGERVLISGPETITWRQFFRAYEAMVGVSSLVFLPAREVVEFVQGRGSHARGAPSVIWRDPRALLRLALVNRAVTKMRPLPGRRVRRALSRKVPAPLAWPSEQELALYRAQTSVSLDRARRVLGYEPRVPFDRGITLTRDFVAWAGL